MKFGKELERVLVDGAIPGEWKNSAIQYKKLKKLIKAIVTELLRKGFTADNLAGLNVNSGQRHIHALYSVEKNAQNVFPSVRITIDDQDNFVSVDAVVDELQRRLSLSEHTFSKPDGIIEDQVVDDDSDGSDTLDMNSEEKNLNRRRSSSCRHKTRVIIIRLDKDSDFFQMLAEELSALEKLEKQENAQLITRIDKLADGLHNVVSAYKRNTDLGVWREIFRIYMEASIFFGDTELNRNENATQRSQEKMKWFIDEMQRLGIADCFHYSNSLDLLKIFISLNSTLLAFKFFHDVNEMAMRKILKKHNKALRGVLLESMSDNPAENLLKAIRKNKSGAWKITLPRELAEAIARNLMVLVPQIESYSCPICMNIAYPPVRLSCNHVFCLRCTLVLRATAAQRGCPMCRSPTALQQADTRNLDLSLGRMMEDFFREEVKNKVHEDKKEVEIRELDGFTGVTLSQFELHRQKKELKRQLQIVREAAQRRSPHDIQIPVSLGPGHEVVLHIREPGEDSKCITM